jgi:hypothetical protein
MSQMLYILLAVALLVYVIGRRLLGEPIQQRRLLVLPLLVVAAGVYQLGHVGHLAAVDLAVILGEAVLAVGIGAARGFTIQVYVRDGHLWQRYRWTTIVVWLVAIGIRLGAAYAGHAAGATSAALSAAALLVLGLSFAAEGAAVGYRALRLGAPFAPRGTRRPRLFQ